MDADHFLAYKYDEMAASEKGKEVIGYVLTFGNVTLIFPVCVVYFRSLVYRFI